MNASSIEKPGEDKVLESQGLAAVTFTLLWSDGRAEHEDEMHVEKFSVWREADFLPAEIGSRLVGMRAGDSAQAALPAGEVTGAGTLLDRYPAVPPGSIVAIVAVSMLNRVTGAFIPREFFTASRVSCGKPSSRHALRRWMNRQCAWI